MAFFLAEGLAPQGVGLKSESGSPFGRGPRPALEGISGAQQELEEADVPAQHPLGAMRCKRMKERGLVEEAHVLPEPRRRPELERERKKEARRIRAPVGVVDVVPQVAVRGVL